MGESAAFHPETPQGKPTSTLSLPMSLRPLGIAKEIVEAVGHEPIYAYDDLLFIAHNAFLVQFDDARKNNLKIFFNVDCEAAAVARLERELIEAAAARVFTVETGGMFELVQPEGVSEFQVRFVD